MFNRIGLPLLGLSRHDETLGLLVMADGQRGVGLQRQLLLEGILVFGQLGIRLVGGFPTS